MGETIEVEGEVEHDNGGSGEVSRSEPHPSSISRNHSAEEISRQRDTERERETDIER